MLSKILFRSSKPLVFPSINKSSLNIKLNFSNNAKILELNNLHTIPGAFKKRRRWGRGVGSGRGKTCGWGHQKSRSTPRGFEGGQTPLYKRLPKIGFHNFTRTDFQVVNVSKIQEFISQGRLVPRMDSPLTLRDLLRAGVISSPGDGVKLLADGHNLLKSPIHLEVSDASKQAIATVEGAGGTVTCIHLNKLAIRATLYPFKFDILPHRARPPPKVMEKYLDHTKSGYLSPEVQIRNLKLFGQVTSESRYRREHEAYMSVQRAERQKIKAEKMEKKKMISNNGSGSGSD